MNKDEIIIVSGLPRSGTSLMMQLLQAGGIPLVCDDKRAADVFNPRGYFECEAVKKLATDNACIEGIQGKAIKVLYHLLKHLPEDQRYKIIFMQRPLNEVMLSQDRMLAGLGREEIAPASAELAITFAGQIDATTQWIRQQKNMTLWECDYPDLVKNSASLLQDLSIFLERDLPLPCMQAQIQPQLHRVQNT